MPYIEINYNNKLDDTVKDEIKSECGKLISILPGKSEDWLMVKIDDQADLYFQGNKEKAIMIKVLIYGEKIGDSLLNKFSFNLTEFISKKLLVDPNRIYISYFFTMCWGMGGNNF